MLGVIVMLIINKNLYATILPKICQYPCIIENLIEFNVSFKILSGNKLYVEINLCKSRAITQSKNRNLTQIIPIKSCHSVVDKPLVLYHGIPGLIFDFSSLSEKNFRHGPVPILPQLLARQ